MGVDEKEEVDPDTQAQLILLAASHHNLESLRTNLRTGSASVQDPDTGFTPLHAAVAACEISPSSSPRNTATSNGHLNGAAEDRSSAAESDVEAAGQTMRLLLQNGAIWNDVDNNNETPGCLALRLGLKELYDIMVDAGVRAEMLLNRLDEYEQLAGDEDDDGEREEEAEVEATGGQEASKIGAQQNNDTQKDVIEAAKQAPLQSVNDGNINNEIYLHSPLRFQDGRILDNSDNGVMMAWETDIMKRTVDLLVPASGLKILNIGHGMGIIDSFFEEKTSSTHHIIEAHPSVLERMRKDGWYEKPTVVIHEGRWQDIVPKIMAQDILFDAIYFDTFAEDYKALRDFFSDSIIGLLDDGGRWGFFNGLGADRQICYDVYGKVVEMDLFEAGFDTEWESIKVPKMNERDWEGVKRRYWVLREYKLPICQFIG